MNPIAKELAAEKRHTFASLVRVMQLLREPGGCPWDREQTHESIRGNFIEETYEVIEAIDTADASLLREERGDVLMQVVFHARISEEEGTFTVDDVLQEVTEKLMRRREQAEGSCADIHEKDAAYLRACRDNARAIANDCGWRVVNCARDGEPRSVEDIHGEVFGVVTGLL